MADAPVFKRHREEAARSTFNGEPLPPWARRWVETGDGISPLRVTLHHAQSLANQEARFVGLLRRALNELPDDWHKTTVADDIRTVLKEIE